MVGNMGVLRSTLSSPNKKIVGLIPWQVFPVLLNILAGKFIWFVSFFYSHLSCCFSPRYNENK